jgi:hypothetical protein
MSAIRPRDLEPLAGDVAVKTRHWHRLCSLPGIGGACADEACEMTGESQVGPGLEGGLSSCCASASMVAAAKA